MFNVENTIISDNSEYKISISKEKLAYNFSGALYTYKIKFISIIDNIVIKEIITNNIEIMNLIDIIENYLYGDLNDTFCCIKSFSNADNINTIFQIIRGNIDIKDYCNTYITISDLKDEYITKRLMFKSNISIYRIYDILKENIYYDLLDMVKE